MPAIPDRAIRTGRWSARAASTEFRGPYLAAAILALLAGACAPPPVTTAPAPSPPSAANLALVPTTFDRLPGWRRGSQGAAIPPLSRSCLSLLGTPGERSPGAAGIGGTGAEWRSICAAANGLGANGLGANGLSDSGIGGNAAARTFFETWFRPYLVTDGGRADGLFTGYYEPELRGAWTRHGPYRTPIYARPRDLVSVDLGRFRDDWRGQRIAGRLKDGRLVPFDSRAEIEKGALGGRGLELLWVDSPVDAFFLHIQGSGRVAMEDGSVVRLGYAGHNGHAYVAIGRLLVERGEIPKAEVSMQSIRAWLAANPPEGAILMERNPSYVFFHTLAGDGPVGAQGVVLTPGRSLAVDTKFVPLGLPLWLDTTDPRDPARPLRRLVVAQDTGTAIKGAVRGDLFWGSGAAAAGPAGRMKESGRYYLLLPKSARPVTMR